MIYRVLLPIMSRNLIKKLEWKPRKNQKFKINKKYLYKIMN
jgi:hypothetical protein